MYNKFKEKDHQISKVSESNYTLVTKKVHLSSTYSII